MPDYEIANDLVRWARGYWKEWVPKLYRTGSMLQPFTRKEEGQFRLFLVRSAPHSKKAFVMVVSKWVEFVAEVRREEKVSGPEKPNIGFALKHVQVAVDWCQKPVQLTAQKDFVKMVPDGYVHPTPKKYVIDESVLNDDGDGTDDA